MHVMDIIRRLKQTRVWEGLIRFFGNRDNAAIATHLRELSTAARDCAKKVREGLAMDLIGITEDEHRGDKALEALSLAVEKAFIPRETMKKADVTYLGHELDDVIDGMRDVAEHITTFKRFLPELPDAGVHLIEFVYEGVEHLDALVRELTNGPINFEEMNMLRARISELERRADRTKRDAIRDLANREGFNDFREFDAQKDLIDLLEGITDHVKHCAVIVVSMARQEA